MKRAQSFVRRIRTLITRGRGAEGAEIDAASPAARQALSPHPPVALESALGSRGLSGLDYVVFDTETTGLHPAVDDLIAIAGVRIAGGQIRHDETFERLIDPGRRIPAASTRIHGITDLMVKGMPPARLVLPEFHGFAKGAVLIAHNAAFDLAFLARKEADSGVAFDNPILDTLLLSRFLDPGVSDHSFDSVAARHDVVITGRHTARGDAEATAALFLLLLDRMAARGVTTFEAARRVCGTVRHPAARIPNR
jgi:DNA polymerase-3 subunit epsilon